ncbi:hypothetical protein GCM10022253_16010 [Sphingomonas endophytica]|uniref:Flagellar hook-length control protein-like C-terminal domain-containing protein n=1 Tax=Sphingomonas endophytica TaxID=869719 RepID=A0ABR6N4B6_9SPHN|nr:flagellar hook-length control protein FliK [Sphingomonas endophytica]MBB5725643.1 hypothetical protein [Sphingomonas endophytica]
MEIVAAPAPTPERTSAAPRPGAGTASVDFGGMVDDQTAAAPGAALVVPAAGAIVSRGSAAGLAGIVPPLPVGATPVRVSPPAAASSPGAALTAATPDAPAALPEALPPLAPSAEDATPAAEPATPPAPATSGDDAPGVAKPAVPRADTAKTAALRRALPPGIRIPAPLTASVEAPADAPTGDDGVPAGKASANERERHAAADDAPATPTPLSADQVPTAVASLAVTVPPPAAPRNDRIADAAPRTATASADALPGGAAPPAPSRPGEKDVSTARATAENGPAAATDFGARVDVAQASPAAPAAPVPPTPSAAPAAEPTASAAPGRLGHDIGVHIARHVADGREQLTVRLNPANMGRVDVRLSFTDEGHLHAAVRADNPAALDMLRRDAPDLGRALADAGISTDLSSFSFDRSDGHASGFGQSPHPQQDRRAVAAATPVFAPAGPDEAAIPAYRPGRSGARINLMA